MATYGYFRILNLNNQSEEDKQALLDKGIEPEKIFSEPFAPKHLERIELEKVKELLQPGDVMVVPQMIYLGNSVSDILDLMKECLAKKVMLDVLDMGVIDDTLAGQMIIKALEGAHHLEQIRSSESRAYMQQHYPESEVSLEMRLVKKLQRKGIKDKVIEVMRADSNLTRVSRKLGIGRTTVYRWQRALIFSGDLVLDEKSDPEE